MVNRYSFVCRKQAREKVTSLPYLAQGYLVPYKVPHKLAVMAQACAAMPSLQVPAKYFSREDTLVRKKFAWRAFGACDSLKRKFAKM